MRTAASQRVAQDVRTCRAKRVHRLRRAHRHSLRIPLENDKSPPEQQKTRTRKFVKKRALPCEVELWVRGASGAESLVCGAKRMCRAQAVAARRKVGESWEETELA